MTIHKRTLKTVLIGAGKFIQETVLPALMIQKNNYEIVHIVTKSGLIKDNLREKLINTSPQLSNTLKGLSSIDFDCIFIAVPQTAIKSIFIEVLRQNIRNKTFLFTTPIAPINCFKYLKKVKN